MFGDVKIDKLENYIKKYFERFDCIEKAAAIYVTDDGHMGYGRVYENSDGELNLLDKYRGYQRAKGFDVQGMIFEDFYIKPTAERMW